MFVVDAQVMMMQVMQSWTCLRLSLSGEQEADTKSNDASINSTEQSACSLAATTLCSARSTDSSVSSQELEPQEEEEEEEEETRTSDGNEQNKASDSESNLLFLRLFTLYNVVL